MHQIRLEGTQIAFGPAQVFRLETYTLPLPTLHPSVSNHSNLNAALVTHPFVERSLAHYVADNRAHTKSSYLEGKRARLRAAAFLR